MASHPTPVVPTDPFMWHESVLSTRSLSYMSTVSALGTNPLPSPLTSRNPSVVFMSRPHDTMDEESEYDLEMTRRDDESLRTVLPESVANSLLFELPREIRDRIYSFCLTATERSGIEWPVAPSMPLRLCPNLLQTCKIIFSEAAQVLYSSNKFVFTHPSDANVFVRAICSRLYTGLISSLELQIRAQDARLWAPYLTSQSMSRSLRHDFADLRDLTIHYKSTRWHQHAPINTNMRAWREDRPLLEIVNSLRLLYYPKSYPTSEKRHADLLQLYLPPVSPLEAGTLSDVDMSAELQQRAAARERLAAQQAGAPNVRVICMLKLPLADFGNITATAALGPSWHTEVIIDPHEMTDGIWRTSTLRATIGDPAAPPQTPAELLVEDVSMLPLLGPQDLRARARRIDGRKPLFGAHAAVAARSTYWNLDGIMFALELYSHLPEK